MSISLLPEELRAKEAEEKRKAELARTLPEFEYHLPEKVAAAKEQQATRAEDIGVKVGSKAEIISPGEFRIVKKTAVPPVAPKITPRAKTEAEIRSGMIAKSFVWRIFILIGLSIMCAFAVFGANLLIDNYQQSLKKEISILSQTIDQTIIATNSYNLLVPISQTTTAGMNRKSITQIIYDVAPLNVDGMEYVGLSVLVDGEVDLYVSMKDKKTVTAQTDIINKSTKFALLEIMPIRSTSNIGIEKKLYIIKLKTKEINPQL